MNMKQLQRLNQFGRGIDLGHPNLPQEGRRGRTTPGKAGGMTGRRRARQFGLAGLDRHNPLARRPRPLGQCSKGRGIVDPLDVKAQRRDPRIVQQGSGQIGQPNRCRICLLYTSRCV